MSDLRIAQLVDELDSLVPRDQAVIRPGEFINSLGQPALAGNRRGYLRLGIELLRIADRTPDPAAPARVTADLEYLIDPADDTGEFATFERTETIQRWQAPPGYHGSLAHVVWVVVVWGIIAVFVAALLIGFGDILGWIKSACPRVVA